VLPVQVVQQLAKTSPALADFLNRRVMHLLELSRQAMQAHWSSQTLRGCRRNDLPSLSSREDTRFGQPDPGKWCPV
jgi:hypothetical protein